MWETLITQKRIWVVIHTDVGLVLFGAWYRPPNQGETTSIQSLVGEFADYGHAKIGTILCGDMSIHHKGWLVHSNNITQEGKCLFDICCTHHFRECIKLPTRGKHLLDLTLTSIQECFTCKVVPRVSDHQMVVCRLELPLFPDSLFSK